MSEHEAYKLLKKIRTEKGLSQNDLAKKVGLSQQAVALIESGRRKLELNMFISMLNSMNLTSTEMNAIMDALVSNESIEETMQKIADDSKIELEYQKATLNAYFNRLNKTGKKEAVKRIGELTEIKKYTEPDNTPSPFK